MSNDGSAMTISLQRSGPAGQSSPNGRGVDAAAGRRADGTRSYGCDWDSGALSLYAGPAVRDGGAGYPSGQRELTVNQPAQPSGVRIPHLPPQPLRTGPASLVGGRALALRWDAARPGNPPHSV